MYIEQVSATVLMVRSDWLEERMREKDEWRFATTECGGQCVTMAGMKWMQMLSVINLDMEYQVRGIISALSSHIKIFQFSQSNIQPRSRRWSYTLE